MKASHMSISSVPTVSGAMQSRGPLLFTLVPSSILTHLVPTNPLQLNDWPVRGVTISSKYGATMKTRRLGFWRRHWRAIATGCAMSHGPQTLDCQGAISLLHPRYEIPCFTKLGAESGCYQDKTVLIWTKDTPTSPWVKTPLKPSKLPESPEKFPDVVWRVSWSLAGNILAVSCGDRTVTLWKENLQGVWECVSDQTC